MTTPEPELTGVRLPDELGAPLTVTGWVPETGQVEVEVGPEHPAYAALTEGTLRGLSLPDDAARAEALSPGALRGDPAPDWRPLLRGAPGWPCVACGSETPGWHGPGCPGSKIELPGNAQVAPEPAGNFRRPSPSEENPVDELPRLSMTVSLSLTVPADAVPATVARLSATLSAAVQEAGEDGWLGAASLSVYPVTDEDEDGAE